MPYVTRNETGQIVALHHESAEDGMEFLNPDHQDVLAFLAGATGQGLSEEDVEKTKETFDQLLQSDLGLIRVIEDVVRILLAKGVFRFDELPEFAQEKLRARDNLRQSLYTPLDFELSQDDDGLI